MELPGLIKHEKYQIHFMHVPTDNIVTFEGWVTEFSDQYTSLWNPTSVYGRMDPLATFQRTSRAISLGFDVVAASRNQSEQNLADISTLIKFLYPVYQEAGRAQQNTLAGGPLIGLRWTNLVGTAAAKESYLYGYLGGLNYGPNVADGGFLRRQVGRTTPMAVTPEVPSNSQIHGPDSSMSPAMIAALADAAPHDPRAAETVARNPEMENQIFFPKSVNVSLQFTVLHTHLMGWAPDENGKTTFGGAPDIAQKFPYQAGNRKLDELPPGESEHLGESPTPWPEASAQADDVLLVPGGPGPRR